MDEKLLKKLKRMRLQPTPKAFLAEVSHGSARSCETAAIFLELGISPDSREPKAPGRTALMMAVSRNRSLKFITRLLEAGAHPALTDEDGWSSVAHLVSSFDAEMGARGHRNLTWSPSFIPFAAGDVLFTTPRMLGDRAIIKPVDPTYIYWHDEDRVARKTFRLVDELRYLFHELEMPRG